MVAGGEHVRALVEQLFGNTRSDPKAPGRVLDVDHHQVDAPLLDYLAEVLADNTSTGLAKYVTDKENAQKTSISGLSANDPATGTKYSSK
jgi:hypothetical protein